MNTTAVLERTDPLEELASSSWESTCALKVAVVYEDYLTRERAKELHDRVTRLAGPEWVGTTWWRIEELTQPAVFPPAVEAAARADVLVISVHAKEELPLDLYAWIDAWLPRRHQQPGALVALISREKGSPTSDFQVYLQAVAQLGGLDFLPREYEPLELPCACPMENAPQRPYTNMQALSTVLSGAPEASRGHNPGRWASRRTPTLC